jgi:acyl-CoA thioesterase-2
VTVGAVEAGTRKAALDLASAPTDALGLHLAAVAGDGTLRALPRFGSLDEILAVLDLAGDATPPIPVRSLGSEHGGVLGAQQLAQLVVLSERLSAGKAVQTLHSVFPNPSRWDAPLDVDVEWLQSGRSFAHLSLTFRQRGRAVSRSDVLLGAELTDFVRHEAAPEDWAGPDAAALVDFPMFPWETRTRPGPQPFSLDLWQRIPEAPADPTLWRALLAFGTEPLIVHYVAMTHAQRGAAPRPGEQRSSAVLAQTITFLEELDPHEWFLLRVTSPHAGHGRVLGRGEIHAADGRLCAVFESVGMLRTIPARGR